MEAFILKGVLHFRFEVAHSLDGFENRIVLEFLERVSIAAGINQALANTQPVGPPGAR
jgi:hypothetical protein